MPPARNGAAAVAAAAAGCQACRSWWPTRTSLPSADACGVGDVSGGEAAAAAAAAAPALRPLAGMTSAPTAAVVSLQGSAVSVNAAAAAFADAAAASASAAAATSVAMHHYLLALGAAGVDSGAPAAAERSRSASLTLRSGWPSGGGDGLATGGGDNGGSGMSPAAPAADLDCGPAPAAAASGPAGPSDTAKEGVYPPVEANRAGRQTIAAPARGTGPMPSATPPGPPKDGGELEGSELAAPVAGGELSSSPVPGGGTADVAAITVAALAAGAAEYAQMPSGVLQPGWVTGQPLPAAQPAGGATGAGAALDADDAGGTGEGSPAHPPRAVLSAGGRAAPPTHELPGGDAARAMALERGAPRPAWLHPGGGQEVADPASSPNQDQDLEWGRCGEAPGPGPGGKLLLQRHHQSEPLPHPRVGPADGARESSSRAPGEDQEGAAGVGLALHSPASRSSWAPGQVAELSPGGGACAAAGMGVDGYVRGTVRPPGAEARPHSAGTTVGASSFHSATGGWSVASVNPFMEDIATPVPSSRLPSLTAMPKEASTAAPERALQHPPPPQQQQQQGPWGRILNGRAGNAATASGDDDGPSASPSAVFGGHARLDLQTGGPLQPPQHAAAPLAGGEMHQPAAAESSATQILLITWPEAGLPVSGQADHMDLGPVFSSTPVGPTGGGPQWPAPPRVSSAAARGLLCPAPTSARLPRPSRSCGSEVEKDCMEKTTHEEQQQPQGPEPPAPPPHAGHVPRPPQQQPRLQEHAVLPPGRGSPPGANSMASATLPAAPPTGLGCEVPAQLLAPPSSVSALGGGVRQLPECLEAGAVPPAPTARERFLVSQPS
jgi:hypothetical protein